MAHTDIQYLPIATVEVADDQALTLVLDWSSSEQGEWDPKSGDHTSTSLSAQVSLHLDSWLKLNGDAHGEQRIPLGRLSQPKQPSVFVLLFHDVWDVSYAEREGGPKDVSIEGIFTTREAAEAAQREGESNLGVLDPETHYYTIEEHALVASSPREAHV